MLENHLIPYTNPVAQKKQIYREKNLRITVLTPRLIRVESGSKFTDSATQIVWFREFPACPFKVENVRHGVTIKTEEAEFFYNYVKKAVTQVIVDGKKIRTIVSNEYNLKGTARSLDNSIGAVDLGNGVISRMGVAVMADSSLLVNADGLLSQRSSNTKDVYIFAHGLDYRRALTDFYKITGPVPLLPRAALGNWWSRWKAYTQNEYISLIERFKNEHIPFSMATVDMDWHLTNIKKLFPDYKSEKASIWTRIIRKLFWGDGWTGYTWNRELFPDYEKFLKWLKDNGLSTTFNLHPSSGVRWFEEQYSLMAKEVGIDPQTRQTVAFDMTNPRFINAYFKHLHRPYEKSGVDYWWVDWQQGRISQQKNLDPLWALNHYHSLEAGRGWTASADTKRPFILSRYAGPGSHRYPIGFSGDTMSNWRVLRFQPYFTATAANIGYTWWSHDIGGHWGGIKNDELYLRWLQFGVFSPINRLHSTRNELMGKEVWNYRPDVEHYAMRLLVKRHKLIPYIYTMNYRTHSKGFPICEPLYYQYPEQEQAYKYKNQYFFGSELMVCPITKKSSSAMALSTVKVWLPEGRWTDIMTDRVYQGNCEIVLAREIHEIPVFAREGAIIPMANEEEIFNPELPQMMDIHVYRGTGRFDLYEDNGKDRSHEQGNFAVTQLSVQEQGQRLVFQITNAKGGGVKLLPQKRKYRIIFKDIASAQNVAVKVNGKAVKCKTRNSPLTVQLENVKPTDSVEIFADGFIAQGNVSFADEVVRLFSRLGIGNIRKMLKYRRMKKFLNDKVKFSRRIKRSRIPRVLKLALNELVLMDN